MNKFEFNLENFDGPLDLLLSLVKDKKADLFTIDLADLATQYLEIINHLEDSNVDVASEYLVMAATLIHIKAKMLLLNPEEEDEEIKEDKEMLLKQLIEYQQFKEVAKKLRQQESIRSEIFIKDPSNYDEYYRETDETLLDGRSNSLSLMNTLRKMFERVHAENLRQTKIEAVHVNPEQRIKEIRDLFDEFGEEVDFAKIFNVPTITHFVITFLVLLDLARKQEIKLIQDKEFGEIRIIKIKGVENEQ
ncbi:segregation/condensation protein A [[Mycoplasma] mobile]|uniref:Segregation and condensation protein A n=1 Tax=Mycoplasma mobile (strain ATCC 43663 / 163K / NCTC 11711) TaxID=267748 RepID=SCPA_MYCM1|nr:segregation/condensation protein A [[Mycoplasma] mobile]Q6KHG7.1 RecName: Full=Segregation and condensation protein A [Mycoplasma mobile 163K]AAT27963.1 expressed protein [Mycoplasma mobile 163K]